MKKRRSLSSWIKKPGKKKRGADETSFLSSFFQHGVQKIRKSYRF